VRKWVAAIANQTSQILSVHDGSNIRKRKRCTVGGKFEVELSSR
jgi:hypothetical protein